MTTTIKKCIPILSLFFAIFAIFAIFMIFGFGLNVASAEDCTPTPGPCYDAKPDSMKCSPGLCGNEVPDSNNCQIGNGEIGLCGDGIPDTDSCGPCYDDVPDSGNCGEPDCGCSDACDPACGGDPVCDPACGGDACIIECGGDPVCDPACGGDPADPSCGNDPPTGCDEENKPDPSKTYECCLLDGSHGTNQGWCEVTGSQKCRAENECFPDNQEGVCIAGQAYCNYGITHECLLGEPGQCGDTDGKMCGPWTYDFDLLYDSDGDGVDELYHVSGYALAYFIDEEEECADPNVIAIAVAIIIGSLPPPGSGDAVISVTPVFATNGVCDSGVGTCTAGTGTDPVLSGDGTTYSWICQGEYGGDDSPECTASAGTAGVCGSVAGTCSSGTPASGTQSGQTYSWQCLGENGGADASCSATVGCSGGTTYCNDQCITGTCEQPKKKGGNILIIGNDGPVELGTLKVIPPIIPTNTTCYVKWGTTFESYYTLGYSSDPEDPDPELVTHCKLSNQDEVLQTFDPGSQSAPLEYPDQNVKRDTQYVLKCWDGTVETNAETATSTCRINVRSIEFN